MLFLLNGVSKKFDKEMWISNDGYWKQVQGRSLAVQEMYEDRS